MEEEQAIIATTTETTAVPDSAEKSTESAPSTPEPETYSKEEYKKAIQSSQSKAKYELLKELGINNVQEFKNLKGIYDTSIKEKTDLEAKQNEITEKYKELQSDLLLEKLGVSDEYKQDLLTLAKNKVDDKHTLEDVSKDLLIKYPQWTKYTAEKIKIGTEKTELRSKEYNKYNSDKW